MLRATEVSLFLCHLLEGFSREGLWPLDGQPKGTVPEKGAQHTQCTGDPKHHGVETHLPHLVMLGEEGRGRMVCLVAVLKKKHSS